MHRLRPALSPVPMQRDASVQSRCSWAGSEKLATVQVPWSVAIQGLDQCAGAGTGFWPSVPPTVETPASFAQLSGSVDAGQADPFSPAACRLVRRAAEAQSGIAGIQPVPGPQHRVAFAFR